MLDFIDPTSRFRYESGDYNVTVSPIYKKGHITWKMMESILTKTMIIPHLLSNLLSNKQYGFISGRSTTTQLLHYLDCCAEVIAEGDVTDAIYFDFSKAFDSVLHQAYRINGNILRWIDGFFSNDFFQTVKAVLHQRKELFAVESHRELFLNH